MNDRQCFSFVSGNYQGQRACGSAFFFIYFKEWLQYSRKTPDVSFFTLVLVTLFCLEIIDDVLANFIVVMVANEKSKDEIVAELNDSKCPSSPPLLSPFDLLLFDIKALSHDIAHSFMVDFA
jgi:hypothetical protein